MDRTTPTQARATTHRMSFGMPPTDRGIRYFQYVSPSSVKRVPRRDRNPFSSVA